MDATNTRLIHLTPGGNINDVRVGDKICYGEKQIIGIVIPNHICSRGRVIIMDVKTQLEEIRTPGQLGMTFVK